MITKSSITSSQVQSAIHRYWRVLMDKSSGEMAKFYSFDSIVFNPFSTRPEPGRVSAMRKEREYFTPKTVFQADMTSPIEVQIVADDTAIATYTFRWRASNMEQDILNKRFDKAVRDGRATQIFRLSPEGELHIISEHLSDVWRDQAQPPIK